MKSIKMYKCVNKLNLWYRFNLRDIAARNNHHQQ